MHSSDNSITVQWRVSELWVAMVQKSGFRRNPAFAAGLHRYVTPVRSSLADSRSSYSFPGSQLALLSSPLKPADLPSRQALRAGILIPETPVETERRPDFRRSFS